MKNNFGFSKDFSLPNVVAKDEPADARNLKMKVDRLPPGEARDLHLSGTVSQARSKTM